MVHFLSLFIWNVRMVQTKIRAHATRHASVRSQWTRICLLQRRLKTIHSHYMSNASKTKYGLNGGKARFGSRKPLWCKR